MGKKFILVLLVLGLVGTASAANWFKGTVGDDWHNPSNWQVVSVPTAADDVFVDGDWVWPYHYGTLQAKVYTGNHAVVNYLGVGNSQDWQLEMDCQVVVATGASLGTYGMNLASMSDGSGPGRLLQEGGYIVIGNLCIQGAGTARATIAAGNLRVYTLSFATGGGIIDIHAGTLKLVGDWRVDDLPNNKNLQQLIANGDIIGWHGASPGINVSYDSMTDTTNVTAQVPEPTTIALLGLGGLALLRRRR